MDVRVRTINITTSSLTGDYSTTVDTVGPILLQVVYEAGANIGSAADLAITDTITGMSLLTMTNFGTTAGFTRLPRRLICNTSGVESTATYDYQVVNREITVAVTSSYTAAQTGTLHLVFG